MRRLVVLGIFAGILFLNIVLLIAFREVNSAYEERSFTETLDFSRQYDVKSDIEYLKNNIEPAYE
jgi:hypothetical protein